MKSDFQDEVQEQAAPGSDGQVTRLTTPFSEEQRADGHDADRGHRCEVTRERNGEHEIIGPSPPVLHGSLDAAIEGVDVTFVHFAGKSQKKERGAGRERYTPSVATQEILGAVNSTQGARHLAKILGYARGVGNKIGR